MVEGLEYQDASATGRVLYSHKFLGQGSRVWGLHAVHYNGIPNSIVSTASTRSLTAMKERLYL